MEMDGIDVRRRAVFRQGVLKRVSRHSPCRGWERVRVPDDLAWDPGKGSLMRTCRSTCLQVAAMHARRRSPPLRTSVDRLDRATSIGTAVESLRKPLFRSNIAHADRRKDPKSSLLYSGVPVMSPHED